jgi:hypothetical protein
MRENLDAAEREALNSKAMGREDWSSRGGEQWGSRGGGSVGR